MCAVSCTVADPFVKLWIRHCHTFYSGLVLVTVYNDVCEATILMFVYNCCCPAHTRVIFLLTTIIIALVGDFLVALVTVVSLVTVSVYLFPQMAAQMQASSSISSNLWFSHK